MLPRWNMSERHVYSAKITIMPTRETIEAPPAAMTQPLEKLSQLEAMLGAALARQAGGGQPLAGVPAGARASADRRRARRGKDHAGAGAGALGFLHLSPVAIHQRHAAQRRAGRHHLQRAHRDVRVQARADLHQFPAGRRDQSHHAADAVGAARSDERASGDHRRPAAFRCRGRSW